MVFVTIVMRNDKVFITTVMRNGGQGTIVKVLNCS